jgi:hypothetical protein
MLISQCHISVSLHFFKEDFKKKWGLVDYYSTDLPCLFFGCYKEEDILKIKEHKGLKVVLFAGADIENVLRFDKSDNVNVISDAMICWEKFNTLNNIRNSIFLRLPIKDYSSFYPVPLGDKIYSYQGIPDKRCELQYRHDLLDKVINHFGKDNVIVGFRGNSLDFVKENYYAQSFINLQLNPMAGQVTSFEMAHMGRKSISNYPAPYCLPYSSVDDIIRLIESEKNKAGNVNQVSESVKNFMCKDDRWLDTEFWK